MLLEYFCVELMKYCTLAYGLHRTTMSVVCVTSPGNACTITPQIIIVAKRGSGVDYGW
jgi:hypothetical protein